MLFRSIARSTALRLDSAYSAAQCLLSTFAADRSESHLMAGGGRSHSILSQSGLEQDKYVTALLNHIVLHLIFGVNFLLQSQRHPFHFVGNDVVNGKVERGACTAEQSAPAPGSAKSRFPTLRFCHQKARHSLLSSLKRAALSRRKFLLSLEVACFLSSSQATVRSI